MFRYPGCLRLRPSATIAAIYSRCGRKCQSHCKYDANALRSTSSSRLPQSISHFRLPTSDSRTPTLPAPGIPSSLIFTSPVTLTFYNIFVFCQYRLMSQVQYFMQLKIKITSCIEYAICTFKSILVLLCILLHRILMKTFNLIGGF